jgi:hypothetical protein
MITGFEKETHELTEYELMLVPKIVGGLKKKVGKENAVTSTDICKAFKERNYKIDGPRLRKIINHIRINNMVPNLIATSKGYYVGKDESECLAYIESLDQRANEIILVRDAMKYQLQQTMSQKSNLR